MNVNTDTWFQKSITKHWFDVCATASLNFKSTDLDLDASTWTEWVELYIDGPSYKEESNNDYSVDVDIELSIVSRATAANVYRAHDIVGILVASMQQIDIYKYGQGDALLTCLTLNKALAKNIRKVYYGSDEGTDFNRVNVIASYQVQVVLT